MKLPEGWLQVRLEEIADVTLGQSPPGSSYNSEAVGVPFFQGKAEFGALRPTIRKWTTNPKKLASIDDVLLSVRAPVGPTNLAPCDCAVGRGLTAVRPLGGIDPRYVLWGLRATADALAEHATGTTFEAVTGSQVRAHQLPIAPLGEQHRIVAAIEEQFSRLDSGDASLRAAQTRLTLYKREVLARSVPADANERTLESIAEASKHAITDGPFGSNLKTAHYTSAGPRVIRLQNIGDGEFIDAMAHVSSDHFERLRKHEVLAGDVVIAALGEELPRACVIPEHVPPAIVKADCFRIRLGSDALPAYVALVLNAPQTRRRASRIIHGVGRPRLNLREVRQLSLPIPTVEVQRNIVADFERQISITDAMATEIDRALLRSAALRRSILAEGFAGKLVPQNASDAPASALLERIAAECATRPKPPRRRRRVPA